ncbi:MAG TPA: hypothetical protein VGC01_05850, partial [Mucilaginibacter sp.]
NQPAEQTDLQGGTAEAIGRYIERNLPKDQSLSPVVISIKELKLTETATANERVDGHVKLSLSFSLQKDYGVEHLVDYHGGLHYIRTINNTSAIEPRLRTLLTSALVYFNDWMKTNTNDNRKLAKNVQFSFTDYADKIEGDTIYYAANRPLTWADFQSPTKPPGRFEAEVMPGFGYGQQAEVVSGTVKVNIAMKTFVPKSACWANYTGRDAYALNHEQRHFDIAKIIAGQFKQKILAAKLSPDDYEGFINVQYFDSYRDMDTMQKAYDKETDHGTNRFAQAEWNDRIDRELKKFSEIE